jgi:hypothetical protein
LQKTNADIRVKGWAKLEPVFVTDKLLHAGHPRGTDLLTQLLGSNVMEVHTDMLRAL